MSTTEKTPATPAMEKVAQALHDLTLPGRQGRVLTPREAAKLFTPLSGEELVELHVIFGQQFNEEVNNAYEVENGEGPDVSDDDASLAVETMQDALNARHMIWLELFRREQKARAAKKKKAA